MEKPAAANTDGSKSLRSETAGLHATPENTPFIKESCCRSSSGLNHEREYGTTTLMDMAGLYS